MAGTGNRAGTLPLRQSSTLPYGEGLETERTLSTPRQSLTRQTFFKSIKQHLRIKTFVGTSKNAVMVQLWTALIAILLLKYIKMLSSFPKWSFSTMIALLHFNLFTYRDLRQWLNDPMEEPPYLLDDGQLAFPGFGQQTGG